MAVTILLAENDSSIRFLQRHWIENSPTVMGVQVFETSGLQTTLRMLRKYRVDLVVLDLNLNDSQGLLTLKTIREEFNRIPILVVTGAAVSVQEVINAGANGVAGKPIDEKQFVGRVEEQLAADAMTRKFEPYLSQIRSALSIVDQKKAEYSPMPPSNEVPTALDLRVATVKEQIKKET